jgi:hypothetical protein
MNFVVGGQWYQMQLGKALLLKIRNFVMHSRQIVREQIDIARCWSGIFNSAERAAYCRATMSKIFCEW